ncbi:MAG: LamG domain-containing protein [Planctomycetes bacterium]|nr:LamG domain-containing protein [Planctomycetota bacterium]
MKNSFGRLLLPAALAVMITPFLFADTIVDDTQTEFAPGQLQRITDAGASDSAPQLELSYHSLPIDNATLGMWRMDEASGNAIDGASFGNNGTLTGTVTSATGKFGDARQFDGSTGYFQLTDSAIFKPANQVTVEAWVKTTDTYGFIFEKQKTSWVSYALVMGWSTSGKAEFIADTDSDITGHTATSTTSINDGNWHYIAGTYDGATVRVYVDGNLEAETAWAGTLYYDGAVGPRIGFHSEATTYLSGAIDDLRVSGIARTPEEIKSNGQKQPYGVYISSSKDLSADVLALNGIQWSGNGLAAADNETPSNNAGLAGAWNFNETSGVTPTDSSASGIAGVLTGFADTTAQDVVSCSGWTSINRKSGTGSLMFDGTNDYITLGNPAQLQITGELTVEAWIKTQKSDGTVQRILSKWKDDTGNLRAYSLSLNSTTITNNRAVFAFTTDGLNGDTVASKTIILPGRWYHVAATVNSATCTIYVNGVAENSTSGTSAIFDSSANVFIGARPNAVPDNFFMGIMDAVRVYNRAITSSEAAGNSRNGSIQLQTRTSADGTAWEEWRPATPLQQIDGLDSKSEALDELNSSKIHDTLPNDKNLLQPQILVSSTTNNYQYGAPFVIQKPDNTYRLYYAFSNGTYWALYYRDTNNTSLPSSSNIGAENSMGLGTAAADQAFKPFIVRKSDNTYRMYYSKYVTYWQLAYRDTNDTNPPTSPSPGGNLLGEVTLDISTALADQVIGIQIMQKPDSTYRLYYSRFDTSATPNFYKLAYRDTTNTSLPDKTSTNIGAETLMGIGTGPYDEAFYPWIVPKTDGTYRMYYNWRNRQEWGDFLYRDTTNAQLPDNTNMAPTPVNMNMGMNQNDRVHDTFLIQNPDGTYRIYYRIYMQKGTTAFAHLALRDVNTGPKWASISEDTQVKTEGASSLKITTGAVIVDANTAGLWKLEETSSTASADASSYANNGTIYGSPSVTTGRTGNARLFNNSSDYIRIADSASLSPLNAITIEAWIKPSNGTDEPIVSKEGANKLSYTFRISSSKLQVLLDANGTAGWDYTGPITGQTLTVDGSTWYHVAMTWSIADCVVRQYVNGALDGTGYFAGPIYDSTSWLGIGANSETAATFFGGTIDEVRVSNCARTTEEIADAYKSGYAHKAAVTLGSTDLSGSGHLTFDATSDRMGTNAEAFIGESDYSCWIADSNTVALWEFNENSSRTAAVADDFSTDTSALWTTQQITDSVSNGLYSAQITNVADPFFIKDITDFDESNNFLEIRYQNYASGPTSIRLFYSEGTDTPQGTYVETCAQSFTIVPDTQWHMALIEITDEEWLDNDGIIGGLRIDLDGATLTGTFYVDYIQFRNSRDFNVPDSSANGNNAFSASAITRTQGKIGNAIRFNGTSDCITANDNSLLDITSNITVEAWINPATINTSKVILGKRASATSIPYDLMLVNSSVQFYIYDGANNTVAATSSGVIAANKWYHVAGTYDGTAVKVYVNGLEMASTPRTAAIPTNNMPVVIGKRSDTNADYFSGVIDQVRISNTARSAAEIRQACEYELRAHHLTADFVRAPSFASGTAVFMSDTSGINAGDTLILKENSNIEQSVVSSIVADSYVTLATALANAYTSAATVQKWQKEYWDLSGIPAADRDAIVKFGIRFYDASQSYSIWLDNLQSEGPYLTDSTGSTITSTIQQYFQYRAIATTTDTGASSAQLKSVTLDYIVSYAPNQPVNSTPANIAVLTATTVSFSSTALVSNNPLATHASSQWQIRDTAANYAASSYDSGEDAVNLTSLSIPSGTLNDDGTIYYWHVRYRDNYGKWSNYSTETYFSLAPPYILYARTLDTDSNSQIDRLIVDASEDIDGTSQSALTGLGFSLTGYTILSGAETTAGRIEFTLAESGTADIDSTPDFSYSSSTGDLTDMDGLPSAVQSYASAPVATSTYVSTFQYLDTNSNYHIDTLIFTFSKNLTGVAEISDWTVIDADNTTNLLAGLTDAAISYNQNQVYIFLSDTLGTISPPSYEYNPSGANDLADSNDIPLFKLSSTSQGGGGGGGNEGGGNTIDETAIPGANAGSDIDSDPAFITLDGSESLNSDGNKNGLTFFWEQQSGPDAVTLQNADTVSPSFAAKKSGTYTFKLTVTDTDASDTDTMNVTINNIAPMANAGKNIIVTGGDPVLLNGSAYDLNEDTLTYSWTAISIVKMQNINTLSPTVKTKYLNGIYEITVVANDGLLDSEPSTMTLVVLKPDNNVPNADAGLDVTVQTGYIVTLDGTASTDDGAIETYSWSQTGGPETVTLSDSASSQPEFIPAAPGVYEFQLTVSDSTGITSFADAVLVTVNSETDILPQAIATANPQNTTVGTLVTLSAAGSYDVNNDALTYLWEQTSGPQAVISSTTSQIVTFTPIQEGTYTFEMSANDGTAYGMPYEVSVYVEPEGVTEFPSAIARIKPSSDPDNDTKINVAQNPNIVLDGSQSTGLSISYFWEQISGPTVELFLTTNPECNFNATVPRMYKFRLTVTDAGGVEARAEVTVAVENYDATANPSGNAMPVSNAGPFAFAKITETVRLYGANSYDSAEDADEVTNDTNGLEFFWQQTEGPLITLSDPYSPNPTFVPIMQGTYKFILYVNDGISWSLPDEVTCFITTVSTLPPPEKPPEEETEKTGSVGNGCFIKQLKD